MVPRQPFRSEAADRSHREVECVSVVFVVSGYLAAGLRALLREEVCATARCRRDPRRRSAGHRYPASIHARLHWINAAAAGCKLGDAVSGYTRTTFERDYGSILECIWTRRSRSEYTQYWRFASA